ncbi:AlpA family phage regulatory protein [Rhizobium leguminosarum]|uniref:helix-turn-helix transcriptional regulator n=1 Tax=Rhizobium leguminosarum TaxID=384 RepID=UPI001030446C|nr:AlpA family phage regulatory protein [Rhizobium leguminosarum]TBG36594.1 AlpA family phage regulatory protein [Rhizobium leguminosarum]
MTSRLIDLAAVLARVPVSKRTLGRWCANGTFPRPIRCGRRVVWHEGDVSAWIEMMRAADAADMAAHGLPVYAHGDGGDIVRAAKGSASKEARANG